MLYLIVFVHDSYMKRNSVRILYMNFVYDQDVFTLGFVASLMVVGSSYHIWRLKLNLNRYILYFCS